MWNVRFNVLMYGGTVPFVLGMVCLYGLNSCNKIFWPSTIILIRVHSAYVYEVLLSL